MAEILPTGCSPASPVYRQHRDILAILVAPQTDAFFGAYAVSCESPAPASGASETS
ncbi:MAG: hypothetical protein PHV57_03370 [Methanomicrobiaceae archaeon]|nr:hypothetical protein [Methanomicrobiaceae archaeon]